MCIEIVPWNSLNMSVHAEVRIRDPWSDYKSEAQPTAHALTDPPLCDSNLKNVIEPRHEKPCLRGLWPGKTETNQLSYRGKLQFWNFGFRKYYTI